MLKAAQVGLGWWGSQVTKVLNGSEKLEILYGIDPDPEIAGKYESDYGLRVISDYQQALDDPNVDAVILTIPHRLHEEADAERLGNVAILEAVARSAESGQPEKVIQYT